MGEIADALRRARRHEPLANRRLLTAPTPSPRTTVGSRPLVSADERVPRLVEVGGPSDHITKDLAPELSAPQPPREVPQQHRIPRDRGIGWERRVCVVEPESPTSVRFRHLAVRLRALIEGKSQRSVLVTSALAQEGKTTVSVNLALALASIAPDSRIALVDFDLRRGSVARALGWTAEVGFESVLSGDESLESVRVTTDVAPLDFFPIRDSTPNAHELLGSSAQDVLQALSTRYDFVICDGPPGVPVPDVSLIAPHVGGCLAVSRSGATRHALFKELISLLPSNSILGVFLNDAALPNGGDGYRYYAAESVETRDTADRHSEDEEE